MERRRGDAELRASSGNGQNISDWLRQTQPTDAQRQDALTTTASKRTTASRTTGES